MSEKHKEAAILRWSKVSKETKSETMSMVAKKRFEKMSIVERKKIGKMLAEARRKKRYE